MNINPHTLSFPAAAQAAHERNSVSGRSGMDDAALQPFDTTDTVSFSVTAAKAAEKTGEETEGQKDSDADSSSQDTETSASGKKLTEEEKSQLKELQARDKEVKQHEQAHLQVAGQHATSGASYSWQQGPDGKKYAVGGEVSIDTSEIAGDPKATIAKMDQVKRAAMAPVTPSAQDYKVAAEADSKASQARSELSSERSSARKEEAKGDETGTDSASPAAGPHSRRTARYTQEHNPPTPSFRTAA